MSIFVYPRLPLSFARRRIAEIESTLAEKGLRGVEELAAVEHPRAAPVATGGRVADRTRIGNVRSAVLVALEKWKPQEAVPAAQVAGYDSALGRALHKSLEIVPADAAHDETWNFLTLVVCPDVAVRRFPDMHNERMLGTPRNALRRTWFREEVIGDLQYSAEHPLGEDELVGLFERSALARNHMLVRRLAVAVLAYEGTARSAWARRLYKQVTFATGPRLLDALSEDQLDDLIADAATSASGGQAQPAHTDLDLDLDGRFRQAMLKTSERASAELNYDAKPVMEMLAEEDAVAAATRLVMSDRLSQGFIFLFSHERLDLTVEALVASREFAPLFDREVVARAERRLHGYG